VKCGKKCTESMSSAAGDQGEADTAISSASCEQAPGSGGVVDAGFDRAAEEGSQAGSRARLQLRDAAGPAPVLGHRPQRGAKGGPQPIACRKASAEPREPPQTAHQRQQQRQVREGRGPLPAGPSRGSSPCHQPGTSLGCRKQQPGFQPRALLLPSPAGYRRPRASWEARAEQGTHRPPLPPTLPADRAASAEKGRLRSGVPHGSCPLVPLLAPSAMLDCSPRATTPLERNRDSKAAACPARARTSPGEPSSCRARACPGPSLERCPSAPPRPRARPRDAGARLSHHTRGCFRRESQFSTHEQIQCWGRQAAPGSAWAQPRRLSPRAQTLPQAPPAPRLLETARRQH